MDKCISKRTKHYLKLFIKIVIVLIISGLFFGLAFLGNPFLERPILQIKSTLSNYEETSILLSDNRRAYRQGVIFCGSEQQYYFYYGIEATTTPMLLENLQIIQTNNTEVNMLVVDELFGISSVVSDGRYRIIKIYNDDHIYIDETISYQEEINELNRFNIGLGGIWLAGSAIYFWATEILFPPILPKKNTKNQQHNLYK